MAATTRHADTTSRWGVTFAKGFGSRAKSLRTYRSAFSNDRSALTRRPRDAAYLDEPVRAQVVVHERGHLALRHCAGARRRGLCPRASASWRAPREWISTTVRPKVSMRRRRDVSMSAVITTNRRCVKTRPAPGERRLRSEGARARRDHARGTGSRRVRSRRPVETHLATTDEGLVSPRETSSKMGIAVFPPNDAAALRATLRVFGADADERRDSVVNLDVARAHVLGAPRARRVDRQRAGHRMAVGFLLKRRELRRRLDGAVDATEEHDSPTPIFVQKDFSDGDAAPRPPRDGGPRRSSLVGAPDQGRWMLCADLYSAVMPRILERVLARLAERREGASPRWTGFWRRMSTRG